MTNTTLSKATATLSTPVEANRIRIGRLSLPHPGDIVYWVACLGAVGLLLLAAT